MSAGNCKHEAFKATVNVARMQDTGRFVAEISIKCCQCDLPFQFMGLPPGVNFNGATVSLDGKEARIGIYPEGAAPNPLQQLLGVTINVHN